jgi:putative DNA primase/helicase
LDEATGGDAELIRFLQQFAGYCLTGLTSEQVLAFLYGPGGNGKSVLVNTLHRVMGDYAKVAGITTFTTSANERHPEELASLAGARLVSASETDTGRRWAEGRVKNVTGGETIRARFMHENSFEYLPQFKLVILGNHAPTITNLDDALRRRFIIVPFTRRPATPDISLETTLEGEWAGILRWAVLGALDWQAHGLTRPASVHAATAEYFDEQDVFGQFLADRCDVEHGNDHKYERAATLCEEWNQFAKTAGEHHETGRQFNGRMASRGFKKVQIKALGTKGFRGIRLIHPNGGGAQ